MFNLIPKEVRFFDYFEQQSQHIIRAGALLHEMVHHFADARAKAHAIKEVEHQGDHTTHEIIKKLNTTFITPIDREDIHDLASRLDDVLDYIEAAAERLVVYRIKEPTSACRAMADVIVQTTHAMDRTIKCLRNMDPGFHEHTVEVNRLENTADVLLRDSLAAHVRGVERSHRGHQVERDLRDDGDRDRPMRGRGQRDRGDHPQDGVTGPA